MKPFCATLAACVIFLLGTLAAQAANPVPFVNQPLTPESAEPGDPPFILTVNGAGFVSGSIVNWNGSPRPTTFVSSSKLTTAIAASDIAEARTVEVTVVNATPGGGVSNRSFFEVTPSHSKLLFNRTDLATESAPVSVATGDFNGDGTLDAVVVNSACPAQPCAAHGTVSVLLGTTQGTLTKKVQYTAGFDPFFVTTGDFNGDGKLDIAVLNRCVSNGVCKGSVLAFLGKGDGTFKNFFRYTTPSYPLSMAVGDLNNDGKLDLAIASGETLSILFGNGDGTFQPHSDLPSGGSGPSSVAVGDFNGDGKLDLAVTNGCASATSICLSGSVAVLLGNGDGTFQIPTAFPARFFPGSLLAADLNGDGVLDLALLDCSRTACPTNSVSIYMGTAAGPFQPPVQINPGRKMSLLIAADFNGDGRLDLAASGSHIPCPGCAEDSADAILFLGNGNGTFQKNVQFKTGAGPGSIAAGDFNNDGKLDLITANKLDNGVSTLIQFYPSTTAFINEACQGALGFGVGFKALVRDGGAGATPTGEITFSSATAELGTVPLDSSGSASLSTKDLPVGKNHLTAVYGGDALFAPSTSQKSLTCVVGKDNVSVTLAANPVTAAVNQPFTFTATITPDFMPPVQPTGTVQFIANKTVLATVPLINGQAVFTTSFAKAGPYNIKAFYTGDKNFVLRGGFVHVDVTK